MKILAFTDLHGWMEILENIKVVVKEEKIDLVLCAGDFTVFGHQTEEILDEINQIGCEVLLIPGNHEHHEEVEISCQTKDKIIYIHESSYEKDNYFFFGYGGGGFSKRDEKFVKISRMVQKDIKDEHKVIVLFHGPPYKTKLDYIGDAYVGNIDYKKFIIRTQPDLVICGHIHENHYIEDKVGDSTVVNPGPEGMIYEL